MPLAGPFPGDSDPDQRAIRNEDHPVLPVPAAGSEPKYGLQPLGVLYIAAVLRQHGFEVEVIDGDIDGLTVAEMVERILAARPTWSG